MIKNNEPEYYKVPINEKNIEDRPSKYGYGVRHLQLAIFLLCLTTIIIGRGHLPVTIIAMTSNTGDNNIIASLDTRHVRRNNDSKILNYTANNNGTRHLKPVHVRIESKILVKTTQKYKTFKWSESRKEMILYAFNLGYLIVMFPMGVVSQRYGNKLPLQIALIITGIVSIITPSLTEWGGWKALCCCRILQGLCQAGTYPSIQGLLGKWAAAEESATLSSYVYTGLQIGSVIGFQLAGFLGASSWGWPSTFYTVGTLSILCYLVLTIWGSANPLEHKSITDEERNYITGVRDVSKKKLETPWREIFTSKPLWGTVIAEIGTVVIFVLFYNQVPTFLHYHLHIDVRNNGLLTSLPFVASFFSTVLVGWLSDYCTNKNIMSKNNARRIFNSVGTFGMAFCLILTSYTNNFAVVVTCLIMAMAVSMATNAGWMINFIDLAPNFSGTLMSIGNTLSGMFVLTLPVIVSYVVTDVTNIIQWRILYFIVSAMSIIANMIYIVLVSTDIQPWNNGCPKGSSNEEEEPQIITIGLTTKQNLS